MSSNAARQGGIGRWIVIALGGVVFAVFAAVIWYAYVEVMGLGAGGPPPLVRAEAGPIKRAPDDPGGMEIPNRDSAVARVFEETVDGVRRERILPRQDTAQILPEPEPEPPTPAAQPAPSPPVPDSEPAQAGSIGAPIERLAAREPEPPAAEAAAPPAARPSITVTNQPPPAREAAPRSTTPPAAAGTPPQPSAPRPLTPPPAAQPAPPRVSTPPAPPPQPQTAARTPPAASPPARSAPAAGPTFRVQLGAFRSDAAANQAWNLMQSRLGNALGGLRPTVLEAQTSAGTFYRLQAGPLANRDSAVSTCTQVKAAGNDCFIVGPLP